MKVPRSSATTLSRRANRPRTTVQSRALTPLCTQSPRPRCGPDLSPGRIWGVSDARRLSVDAPRSDTGTQNWPRMRPGIAEITSPPVSPVPARWQIHSVGGQRPAWPVHDARRHRGAVTAALGRTTTPPAREAPHLVPGVAAAQIHRIVRGYVRLLRALSDPSAGKKCCLVRVSVVHDRVVRERAPVVFDALRFRSGPAYDEGSLDPDGTVGRGSRRRTFPSPSE
jgi:hypothetical protein